MAEHNGVQSVNHAIDIIEYLYQVGREASISEISAGTGMFGSTIHRQLSTLKERGFVYQNPENAKYWLGLRFYAIGNLVKNNLPIINILAPFADQVAQTYRQTIYIAIPDYSSDVCAHQAMVYRKSFSAVMLRNEVKVGMVIPSHGSATGKCMMAYYPEALIQQYSQTPLVKMTEKTITDWGNLKAEFATIRARGYALDSEEEEDGRTCIAVPVLDSYHNIVASISLSGQSRSIFESPVNAMVRDLKAVADIVASKI